MEFLENQVWLQASFPGTAQNIWQAWKMASLDRIGTTKLQAHPPVIAASLSPNSLCFCIAGALLSFYWVADSTITIYCTLFGCMQLSALGVFHPSSWYSLALWHHTTYLVNSLEYICCLEEYLGAALLLHLRQPSQLEPQDLPTSSFQVIIGAALVPQYPALIVAPIIQGSSLP